jgi:hypothetical protein
VQLAPTPCPLHCATIAHCSPHCTGATAASDSHWVPPAAVTLLHFNARVRARWESGLEGR